MSDTSTVPSVDAQRQQKTLSQQDIDLLAASNILSEQEDFFIQNLNVDEEEKEKKKPVLDSVAQTVVVEPVQEKKVIKSEDMKMYVMKVISRQDISPNLASVEGDFYDKVELIIDEMSENSFFRIEQFVNERLERIIMYCKSFSDNVCNTLTTEERELYIGLCELVSEYRKKMDKRLKIE